MGPGWWALVTAVLAAALSGAVSVVMGWWVRQQAQQSNLTSRYQAALLALSSGNATAGTLALREPQAIAATAGSGQLGKDAGHLLSSTNVWLRAGEVEQRRSKDPRAEVRIRADPR